MLAQCFWTFCPGILCCTNHSFWSRTWGFFLFLPAKRVSSNLALSWLSFFLCLHKSCISGCIWFIWIYLGLLQDSSDLTNTGLINTKCCSLHSGAARIDRGCSCCCSIGWSRPFRQSAAFPKASLGHPSACVTSCSMSWTAAGHRAQCCKPGVLQECLGKQHFQVNRV